jgi:AcrR family transcriptional regulator
MRNRLSRSEQVDRNRELVLEAARQVFLAKGYAGASLDAIAEAAGFSKGVVYSQFGAKGDLFLALLERRMAERAKQNERLVARATASAGIEALFRLAERVSLENPAWAALVIEFRVHAARDPDLARRYARAHAHTIDGVAATLAELHQRAGFEPAFPVRTMAELLLALGSGTVLERLADPDALSVESVAPMLGRVLGTESGAGNGRRACPRAPSRRKR